MSKMISAFLVATSLTSIAVASATLNELRLINKITDIKNMRDVRPAINETAPVTVQIGITLSQVVALDPKNEVLTTSVWIRQKWFNPHVKWNITEYGGLSSVNINPDRVWLPDITLYNSVEGDNKFGGSMDKLSTRVILHHTGFITWLAPAMIRSKCNIDIRDFPFDTQTCDLKFGSWTYDAFRVDLQAESQLVDLSKYTTNAEWQLINMTARRSMVKYVCCSESYPDVTYTLTMKRRSLFYLVNLILPLVMISSLTCITFLIPPEAGQRISLSVTILLCMVVFMLLINSMVPPTSDVVPLVAKFYTSAMVEMTVAVFIACYNISLHHTDPKFYPLPRWMDYHVLGWMSRLAGVNGNNGYYNQYYDQSYTDDDEEQKLLEELMDYGQDSIDTQTNQRKENVALLPTFTVTNVSDEVDSRRSSFSVQSSLHRTPSKHVNTTANEQIPSNQQEYQSKLQTKGLQNKINAVYASHFEMNHWRQRRQEWKQVAMVMDKISMAVFLMVFLATVLWVFASAPGYVE